MQEKIQFLADYCFDSKADISILRPEEVAMIPSNTVPEEWRDIFRSCEIDERVSSIINIWKKYLSKQLSKTICYLQQKLVNVEMIKINNRYSLIYTIESENGDLQYYEGGNPLEQFNNNKLQSIWSKVPDSIRYFYENIHNGFYDYASKAMGMVCSSYITNFSDDEWSIVDELAEPMQIDLKNTFGFFSNGMGGYVAVDVENCNSDKATLWFSDDQPKYNLNFWDVVDEWIVLGLEDI